MLTVPQTKQNYQHFSTETNPLKGTLQEPSSVLSNDQANPGLSTATSLTAWWTLLLLSSAKLCLNISQAPPYIAAEALMLEKIFPPARNKSQDASCDIVSINTGNSSLPWPELGNIFWQRNILLPKQQPSLYHSILFLLHCSEFSLNASNIFTYQSLCRHTVANAYLQPQ